MIIRDEVVDSGSLATLGLVTHKVSESGTYRGTVYRGTARVGTFSLIVSENEDTTSDCGKQPRQVNIDLSSLDGSLHRASEDCADKFRLQAGGNVLFTAPAGPGGYAVELFRREKDKAPAKVFDSRALDSGDLFIAHVMRPGLYSIRNGNGKRQTELTVEYPDPEKLKLRLDPYLVEFNGEDIVPTKIVIQPVQALMFDPKAESRIIIELKKADDRPAVARTPIVTPAKARKRKGPGAAGQRTVIRKIRYYG